MHLEYIQYFNSPPAYPLPYFNHFSYLHVCRYNFSISHLYCCLLDSSVLFTKPYMRLLWNIPESAPRVSQSKPFLVTRLDVMSSQRGFFFVFIKMCIRVTRNRRFVLARSLYLLAQVFIIIIARCLIIVIIILLQHDVMAATCHYYSVIIYCCCVVVL